MAYAPELARILGKVTGGADNVQLRVLATGELVVATDATLPLVTDDLVPGTGAGQDGILVYGSDNAGVTPRVLKTDANGVLLVNLSDDTAGVDFLTQGESLAVAAAATATVLTTTPGAGTTLVIDHVEVHGSGHFKWQVIEFDGVATETVKARGYTSSGTPHARIQLSERYSLVGDAAKQVRIKATNLDLTLQADASAEIVGHT